RPVGCVACRRTRRLATLQNGQTGGVRRRRLMVPASLLFAALLAAFALAPTIVGSSDADAPAGNVPPAAARTAEATPEPAAADRQAAPADDGVELLDPVQYVCRGLPVDPRIETIVADWAR